MFNFCQIANGHVNPLCIIELLLAKGKKTRAKFEMSQRSWIKMQMEFLF
jgi:hypothetical protein